MPFFPVLDTLNLSSLLWWVSGWVLQDWSPLFFHTSNTRLCRGSIACSPASMPQPWLRKEMTQTILQVPCSKLPFRKLPNIIIPHFPRKDFLELLQCKIIKLFIVLLFWDRTECDSRMYSPIINLEDKQIWDSKAYEKLAPISSRQLQVPQLYLSLEVLSFFEMDTVWLFLSSKN